MSERVANWPNTKVTAHVGAHRLELRCSSCSFTKAWGDVLPPNTMRKRAEKAGWRIDGKWKRATCPTCTESERKEAEIMQDTDDKIPTRKAFALLEEHYGERGYEDGWSDDRIAQEIDRSPKFVASIREKYYGPIEDPRLGDLREQIAKARAEADAETNDIRQLVEEHHRKTKAKLDDLGTQLARLTR